MITNKKPFLYFNLLASFFNFDFRIFFYDCEEIFIVAKKFSYSCREFLFFIVARKFLFFCEENFFIAAKKLVFQKSPCIHRNNVYICKENFFKKKCPNSIHVFVKNLQKNFFIKVFQIDPCESNFFFKVQKNFFVLI